MPECDNSLNGEVGAVCHPSTLYSHRCGLECPDNEVLAGASALISSRGATAIRLRSAGKRCVDGRGIMLWLLSRSSGSLRRGSVEENHMPHTPTIDDYTPDRVRELVE